MARRFGLDWIVSTQSIPYSAANTKIAIISFSLLTGTFVTAQVTVGGLPRAVGGRTAAVTREQAARAINLLHR